MSEHVKKLREEFNEVVKNKEAMYLGHLFDTRMKLEYLEALIGIEGSLKDIADQLRHERTRVEVHQP